MEKVNAKEISLLLKSQIEAYSKELETREVVRVITPGTVLDENMLDESKNNFLCSVFFVSAGSCGLTYLCNHNVPL